MVGWIPNKRKKKKQLYTISITGCNEKKISIFSNQTNKQGKYYFSGQFHGCPKKINRIKKNFNGNSNGKKVWLAHWKITIIIIQRDLMKKVKKLTLLCFSSKIDVLFVCYDKQTKKPPNTGKKKIGFFSSHHKKSICHHHHHALFVNWEEKILFSHRLQENWMKWMEFD